MKKIIVLGAGLVGNAIAIDLKKNHNVTSADINPEPLKKLKNNFGIDTIQTDLSKPENVKLLTVLFVFATEME